MTKTIVVTGGAGFIGSHLCRSLLDEGHHVVAVDNLITGDRSNLGEAKSNERFTLCEHDLSDPLYFDDRDIDEIYHLASPASPKDYMDHPIHTLKVGSMGTYHTLGMALEHDASYLLASTSEVYGDPEVHPQTEDYPGNVDPVGPRGVYDEAKRYGEAITMAYHNEHGIDTRIARIFNTYGPRMQTDDGRVIPNFFSQGLRGDPLTVYGDGSQTRSFCYVDDMVEGLIALMEHGDERPTNLGNPHEITILDLADRINEVTENDAGFTHRELPEDDPQRRKPDIGRAREVLGWEPSVGLSSGLEKTLRFFRDQVTRPAEAST